MSSDQLMVDLGDQIVPTEDDLCRAVMQQSLSAMFTILTIWQRSLEKLDDHDAISPGFIISALLSAIDNNRSDMVSLLLAVSRNARLPVMEAIKSGSTSILDAFLWNGWDLNEPMAHNGPSALGFAIHDKALVKWFLDRGADPTAGNPYDTPLSRAVLAGSIEVVRLLLSKGGDVFRGDVIHWAIERSSSDTCEVIELLLEKGAPPNHLRFGGVEPEWSVYGKDGLGTALHRVVALEKLDVMAVLLERGAHPGVRGTNGSTAEQVAKKTGNAVVMWVLSTETEQS